MTIKLNELTSNSNWITGEAEGGYKFQAKLYDEGSEYGINEGRVSKLEINKEGESLIAYDRGWDKMSLEGDVVDVYEEIINFLENSPKEFEEDYLKY